MTAEPLAPEGVESPKGRPTQPADRSPELLVGEPVGTAAFIHDGSERARQILSEVGARLSAASVREAVVRDSDGLPEETFAAIRDAELFIAVYAQDAKLVRSVMSRIAEAHTADDATHRPQLVAIELRPFNPAVSFDDGIERIYGANWKPDAVADRVVAAINRHGVRRLVQDAVGERRLQQIETTTSDYVEETLKALEAREQRSRTLGHVWHLLGYAALVGGVASAVWLSDVAIEMARGPIPAWPIVALLGVKGVLILALLGATSKYAFSLGRSHMGEALKNNDRRHAISFGRFYLKSFGKGTWEELREVFKHWNIAKDSPFAGDGAGDFDPKVLEAVLDLVKTVIEKKAK